jgi:chromosome segregation ATPase
MIQTVQTARSNLQMELEALQQKRAAAKEELANKLAKVETKREQLLEETESGAGTGREEQVATLRKDCKTVKRTIKERNAEIAKLQVQLDACPKDIDRGNFLRLIFDLTSNIRKQQEQIDKMKREIAEADAEINKLHDKIKTVFDVVEQQAFENATGAAGAGGKDGKEKKKKKDDGTDVFGKDLFKKFFDLRKAYDELIAVIESRGGVRKEIHETEQHASKLHLIVSGYRMDGVEQDVQLVQEENEQLQATIDTAKQQQGQMEPDEED